MAKYTVKFSCGHEATIELFGKYGDRARKIKWMEEHGDCPECSRKAREQEIADSQKEAAKTVEENGLPALVGSEKQIAWANEIRAQYVPLINDLRGSFKKAREMKVASEEEIARREAITEGFASEFFAETKASYWIDLRFESTKIYFNKKATEYIKAHM